MNFKFILFSFLILYLYQNIDAQRLTKDDCKCRLPANRRIVGGREVKLFVPWMVSLAIMNETDGSYSHFCGGTIINRKIILTASHCRAVLKNESDLRKIQVRVGMTELNQSFDVQRFGVKSFRKAHYGDIGFIEINGSIKFSNRIQPGCLPNSAEYEDYNDKVGSLHAVGFGFINSYIYDTRKKGPVTPTKLSNRLKEAYFNDVSVENKCAAHLVCIKQFKYPDSICNGDSGSGLMHHTPNGLTRIIGIASLNWSEKIDEHLHRLCIGKSAFTRVSEHIPLIEAVTFRDYCKVNYRP